MIASLVRIFTFATITTSQFTPALRFEAPCIFKSGAMQWSSILGAAALLLSQYVFSNPVPQGNCGSTCCTCTRPIRPTTVERAAVTGEADVVDVTEFIEKFITDVDEGRGRYQASVRHGRPNARLRLLDRSESQQVDNERLGNIPFNFDWMIDERQPAVISIRLRPQTLRSLIEQYSAVNNQVTVVSYRIDWQLHYWEVNRPRIVIPPIEQETYHGTLGLQTIFYRRATYHEPAYVHVPEPATFYRDQFDRRDDGTPRKARLSWRVIVEWTR